MPQHFHLGLAIGTTLNISSNSTSICPEVTFICFAEDLPANSLRWFFNNDDLVGTYDFAAQAHQYPFTVIPHDMTLAGIVDILILSASLNEDNLDQANFLSTMSVNISMLQELGVSNVSCGLFGTRSYLQVQYTSNGGEYSIY